MPILWKYVLKNYFQVFLLCVTGFISLLLVTRLQEIARIATLNAQINVLCLFILCQIPYVLPIAISISGLISAILLMQRLSHTQELTAFRASGMSLKAITSPILFAAFLLSILNFVIVSELTPRCRLYSHDLIQNMTKINPLFLIKNSKLLKFQDSYVDMKTTEIGKECKDIIFAMKNQSNNRLTLLTAKKFLIEDNLMTGKNVTIISNIAQELPNQYDNLIIENQDTMSTSASALSNLMQKSTLKLGFEHLSLKNILSTFKDKTAKINTVERAQFELCRRLFFPTTTFTLTLLGLSLGMHISRGKKRKGIFIAILLSSLTFVSSIAAKSYQLFPHKFIFFYSFPIPVLILMSYYFQKRIVGGIE